jgi:hypothetical protein
MLILLCTTWMWTVLPTFHRSMLPLIFRVKWVVLVSVHIVTGQLKARIVEWIDAAIARQQYGKHVSVATDTDAAIEDALSSVQPVLRLYNEEQLDKPVSWSIFAQLPELWGRKMWSWVPWGLEPRTIVLARASSNSPDRQKASQSVGDWSQHLAVLSCFVHSRYLATTSEQTEDLCAL